MTCRIAGSLIFWFVVVSVAQADPPAWVKLTGDAGFSPPRFLR